MRIEGNVLKEILLTNGCVINQEGQILPPPGMGAFAFQELLDRCRKEAEDEIRKLGIVPHWHEYNPWKDHIVYVPLEELAECHHALGRLLASHGKEPIVYTVRHTLEHWRQCGPKLDAYILTGKIITGGVRYGRKGEQYLSPGFYTPKLWALLQKYKGSPG